MSSLPGMDDDAIPDRVRRHVSVFNQAVRSGDFAALVDRFAPDATMSFDGVPVGPFRERDEILAAYVGAPPDDTMTVTSVEPGADVDVVGFVWSEGGTGTMTMWWRVEPPVGRSPAPGTLGDGWIVGRLDVVFDPD